MKPAWFLFALFACVLGLYYAGALMPRYKVIEKTERAEETAKRYQPLLMPPADGPTQCYWEMLPPRGRILPILYRYSWPDESHPIAWADALYRKFRKVWFGTAEDIEYIMVEVNMDTSSPASLAFESPDVGKLFVGHRPRLLKLGEFGMDGLHPVLRVASWNHLFEPAPAAETPAIIEQPVPLVYLDDKLFEKLAMGRRSQPPDSLLESPAETK